MDRRTETIQQPQPTRNVTAAPARQAVAPLPTRDLGHVYVVQGPGALVSLVRVDGNGNAVCDCATFTASKQPCAHIASAARLLPSGAP